jgi:hypothetical protein
MGVFKELKQTFKKKTKKAFSLTEEERKKIRLKRRVKKIPRQLKRVGGDIDVGRLIGRETRRLPFAKKIEIKKKKKKKRKKPQFKIRKGKKGFTIEFPGKI